MAAAIGKHAPKDALILSWWDTSRQIKLLTGHDTLFTSHLNEPLMIPVAWLEQSKAIKLMKTTSGEVKCQFKRTGAIQTFQSSAGSKCRRRR
jgi:hydroxylamine oxidation protein HaoB